MVAHDPCPPPDSPGSLSLAALAVLMLAGSAWALHSLDIPGPVPEPALQGSAAHLSLVAAFPQPLQASVPHPPVPVPKVTVGIIRETMLLSTPTGSLQLPVFRAPEDPHTQRQPAAEFDAYDRHIQKSVLARWRPDFPKDLQGGLCARVRLFIGAEGEIKRAKFFSPSGNRLFDNSVDRLISDLDSIAQPLPAGSEMGEYQVVAEFRAE